MNCGCIQILIVVVIAVVVIGAAGFAMTKYKQETPKGGNCVGPQKEYLSMDEAYKTSQKPVWNGPNCGWMSVNVVGGNDLCDCRSKRCTL